MVEQIRLLYCTYLTLSSPFFYVIPWLCMCVHPYSWYMYKSRYGSRSRSKSNASNNTKYICNFKSCLGSYSFRFFFGETTEKPLESLRRFRGRRKIPVLRICLPGPLTANLFLFPGRVWYCVIPYTDHGQELHLGFVTVYTAS